MSAAAVRLIFGLALVGPLLMGGPATAQKRVALVIGNAAYGHAAPLVNPANDASDMGAALKEAGFAIILGLDLDKRAFDAKVREFSQVLPQADVGVLFYAAHGLQSPDATTFFPLTPGCKRSATSTSKLSASISFCARWSSIAKVRPTSFFSTPVAIIR